MREIWNHIKATACKFYKWLTAAWQNDRLVFCVWAISFALLIGFGVTLALFGYAKLFGGMSASPPEVLRDIALTVAAILGFPMLLQRTIAATKQADIDSRRLLADRYARAAELFASAKLSARLAGLYALGDLAKEEVEIYHVRIMKILCAFVREQRPSPFDTPDLPIPQHPDIEAVLTLIRERNKEQCKQERADNYRLDFHHTNLQGADFENADLRGASFVEADLCGARFPFADLRMAELIGAKLTGTEDFEKAALNGTNFGGVNDESMEKISNAPRKGVILIVNGNPCPPALPSDHKDDWIDKVRLMDLNDWLRQREMSRRDFRHS